MKRTTDDTKQHALLNENVSLILEQSLTEEQRFLRDILNEKIKTFSHEEVVRDLRRVLGR